MGVAGKRDEQDLFTKDEVVSGIVPGSGPVSVTTWVHGVRAGRWEVSAELLSGPPEHTWRRALRARKPSGTPLPRAGWSWRKWALASAPPTAVTTRWGPLVRLTPMPAVVPGTWSALVGLGIVAGVAVQATLAARAGVSLGEALLVDLVALLSGLLGAKLWYIALRPRAWRKRLGEGWSVDGALVAAPAVGVSMLLALGLPLGAFLDASTPGFFLGVAIGRLGCFLTGCCAGRCTASRWGIWSSDRRIGARRVPAQLLEAAAGLLLAGIALTAALLSPAPAGTIFVGGLAAYVLVRQFLLRLRAESRPSAVALSLTLALAALIVTGGVVLLVIGTA